MSARYFEDREQTREVFPIVINSISPIAFAPQARQLALDHIREYEGNPSPTLGQMMQQQLAPIGTNVVTHVFCSRNGFTHQERMLNEHFAANQELWVAEHTFDENFDPVEVLAKFSVVVGDTAAMLARLGLHEVTNG